MHLPLREDRIKFGVGPEKLTPLGFFDSFTAAIYLEPEVLRRRQPHIEAPFPRQRDVDEVIKLAPRWDAVGRLRRFAPSEVPTWRRPTPTSVRKSERWDRLILDRRGPNGGEARLRRASQELTPGWALRDIVLSEQQSLRL